MSTQIAPKAKDLVVSLHEKRMLFEKMLNENKEFDEVKTLFYEIRRLEIQLKQQHQSFGSPGL